MEYFMLLFFNLCVFLFGLCIGSFLNCLIYRLEQEEKLTGISYCPHCKHNLAWYDLVPVFSFVLLSGKCRYCKKKISIQYPLVEILTGLVFLLIFNTQPFYVLADLIYLCFMWYMASSLIVIFVYDLKHSIIPDKILFPLISITVLYQLVFDFKFLAFNSSWAGFLAFLFFWIIFFISKEEWMGLGDCKLVIFLGLFLGFPHILSALFLSFFFGAIIGLGLMAFGKTGLKSQIPFAPFLIGGSFMAMIFGSEIINWYMHLFSL